MSSLLMALVDESDGNKQLLSAGGLASGGIGRVEVDGDRAVADEDEDDLARLGVGLAVDEPGRHMEEAARLDVDVLAAAGAEVEADAWSRPATSAARSRLKSVIESRSGASSRSCARSSRC